MKAISSLLKPREEEHEGQHFVKKILIYSSKVRSSKLFFLLSFSLTMSQEILLTTSFSTGADEKLS